VSAGAEEPAGAEEAAEAAEAGVEAVAAVGVAAAPDEATNRRAVEHLSQRIASPARWSGP